MHPGLAALDFPHSIIAPWARCDGPSMAQHSSRGILPLSPLHNDCVRPSEKGRLSGCGYIDQPQQCVDLCFEKN